MSRRIDVELTSARSDGSWTWRAAGAREPKGVVEGTLVPGSAKVGDVLRVEADFDVEGITVVSVVPAKGSRREPERIELLGTSTDFEPVTSTLVAKGERRDRDRDRDRDRPRRDRPAGDRPRRDGDRGADRGRGGPDRDRSRTPRPDSVPAAAATAGAGATGEARTRRPHRDRPARPPKPEMPAKPKPARLRPGRKHRNELVKSLPAEQQPIAEQALRGGLPAVRQALDEQNAKLRTEDKPEIKPDGVVSIAEQLLPRLRVAEWLDRAESARADIDQLDLGDLRSVVVASDDAAVARDETTRDLAAELKQALVRRQDEAHHEWLAELTTSLNDGRSVRALRLSSRPPKAGAVFPPDLRTRLGDAAAASLTPDASADRWVAVLEALAYSPVRSQVKVEHPPSTVTDELKATVARLASLLPDVARTFGIEPPPPGSRPPRPPRRTEQRRGAKPTAGAKPTTSAKPTTKTVPPPPATARERDVVEPATAKVEAPVAEPAASADAVEAPTVDASVAETTPAPETVAAEPAAGVAAEPEAATAEPVDAPKPGQAAAVEEPEAAARAAESAPEPQPAPEPAQAAPGETIPEPEAAPEPEAFAPAVETVPEPVDTPELAQPVAVEEPEAASPETAASTAETAPEQEAAPAPEAAALASEAVPEREAAEPEAVAAPDSEAAAAAAETAPEPPAAPERKAPAPEAAPEPAQAAAVDEPKAPAPEAESAPGPEASALEPEREASEPATSPPAEARADVDATTNGAGLGEGKDAGDEGDDLVVPASTEVADEALATRTPSPPDA